MSSPFIIWTMQRTGGTALTELLTAISEHPAAEHEPFNWRGKKPRQFGSVTRGWNETRNAAAAASALSPLFAQRYLIKHCYELHPVAFSTLVMQAAAKGRYRHILLLRRDESARLVSKFVAQATGAWFRDYAATVFGDLASGSRQLDAVPVDQLVAHYRHCRRTTAAIRERLREFEIDPFVVDFEDLYAGDRATRLERLGELLRFLDFAPEVLEEHRAGIDEKLFNDGADIPSIGRFVPNFEEVEKALAAAEREPARSEPAGNAEIRLYNPSDDKARTAKLIALGRHRELVGGRWDEIGALQLDFLKARGLTPQHRVLDIGCGCLRAGVKLVPYLEPDHYYGIDPQKKLLEAGYRTELAAAGLHERLKRANLYCSRLFRHARLAEDSIDFGIAESAMTHLPYNFIRVCLENTEKYFRPGGKLYLSFFELPEGARFAERAINSRGSTTYGAADPYHYYAREMIMAAEGTRWRPHHVGDWGHPLGQNIVEYERG